jgi:hypothetical protein
MFLQLHHFLFPHVPFEVSTSFSLQDSVERLRGATKRSVFSAFFNQAAVGPVDARRVRLQRVIPMFGNSFKPIFVGRFEEIEGRIVLRGTFTMFLFSKVFMSVWLSFALFWTVSVTIATLLSGISSPTSAPCSASAPLWFPLIGLSFLCIGVLFIRVCWWFSRGDIDYLKTVMSNALQDEPEHSSEHPSEI